MGRGERVRVVKEGRESDGGKEERIRVVKEGRGRAMREGREG